MTNEKSYVNMMTTSPVLTVAPPKEETEMFGATENEYYGPFCSSKPELEQHHSG
ncbi:hypothetical protein [Agathobaculum butyriciproducens]|uniref:hypothetical protein n=1 Tax=Agathobaculum butyriciproducens TaxID=1628085 RepID=UPI003A8D853E